MSQLSLFDCLDISTTTKLSKCNLPTFIEAMNFFEDTYRTEESFYLRFQIMPEEMKKAIYMITGKSEDWQIFKEICKFYKL